MLIFVILLANTNKCFAQNYAFRNIISREGLPSNVITALVQDKDGIIWIGTDKGLCYFENGKIRLVEGLASPEIYTLFVDSKNTLWCTHPGEFGITALYKKKIFKNYKLKKELGKNKNVTNIFEYNGTLFFGHSGGLFALTKKGNFIFTKKTNSSNQFANQVVSFFKYKNKLYVTFNSKGIQEVVLSTKSNIELKPIFKDGIYEGAYIDGDNLILTTNPEAKLYSAYQVLIQKKAKPLKLISNRNPLDFTKTRNNEYFGACFNLRYGSSGLTRYTKGFNEELILPELYPGENILHNKQTNQVYFGSLGGLFVVHAQLFAKRHTNKVDIKEHFIKTAIPNQGNTVILSEYGLVEKNGADLLYREVKQEDFFRFAQAERKKTAKYAYFDDYNKNFNRITQNGIALKDFILRNNKWHVLTLQGFFILSKDFKLLEFVPIPARNINYDAAGNLICNDSEKGMIWIPKNRDYSKLTCSSGTDGKVGLNLKAIENINGDVIAASFAGGLSILKKDQFYPLHVPKYDKRQDIVFSTQMNNRYLVVYQTDGTMSFIDQHKDFQLAYTLRDEDFYNEPILDIHGHKNYLMVLTSKRIFIWDGKTLKSTSTFTSGSLFFSRIRVNNENMCLYSNELAYNINVPKMIQSLNRKNCINITPFSESDEIKRPNANQQNTFFTKKNNLQLQFSVFNEFNLNSFKTEYKINGEKWMLLEESGILPFRNLDYGISDVLIRVKDLQTGQFCWNKTIHIERYTPVYLRWYSLLVGLLLLLVLIVLVVRKIILRQQSKKYQQIILQSQLKEIQMEALQSQMNPHFVFNALNSIQKFILDIDKEKALHFLNQFSLLIRKVLDYSNIKTISIEEELEFIQLYTEIENLRFQNLITFKRTIDCDEEIQIPPLLIQPLLENAIIYGKRDAEGKMEIHYSIIQTENKLEIEVSNEIPDFIVKNHPFTSRSKEIIEKRIALFDPNATFLIATDNAIFTTKIVLNIYD